ncbi:MAG TPA: hypothetical protein VFQ67_08065 [Allosphingosinicella sp.]|jgi:hypothetical protein|nr:hypothetical protein [Allosphingosinicella sp.]
MNSDEKICPRCAEAVKKEALVCKHCGHEFAAAGASAAPAAGPAGVAARPKRKLGLLGCLGLGVVAIGAISVFSTAMPEDPKVKAQKEAEEATRKQKGFHCLSSWDGSHKGVVESVKAGLRNPKSFEHVETKILPVNKKGEHELVMTYRAQNGFGGMNVSGVTARIKNSDCSAVAVTRIE